MSEQKVSTENQPISLSDTPVPDLSAIDSLLEDSAYKALTSQYEKKIYDLQQLLEISRSLCTTLELSTLIQSVLYITMAQMRVLGAGVFVLESLDSNSYKLENNYSGLEPDPSIEYNIPAKSPVIEKIGMAGKVFTLKELEKELAGEKDMKYISSLKPTLIVPLNLKNRLNGILLLGERITVGNETTKFSEYEKNEISTIASLAAIAVNNASLVEQSSTDMMTHLKLKYYFFNILTDKLDLAFSQNQSISVIMFDIDFFKKFNDTYGHACGDYVLQSVARIIKEGIRGQDMASRYGGEEFTVMLHNTGKDEAMLVAERIRQKIEANDFFYEDQHMQVTISSGVSVFSVDNNPVTSAKQLVEQADQALYISKRNGRNRVTYADPAIIAAAEQSS
jgi:two-component system cell cycle response regulator